jgi:hypothetical protein
MEPPLDTLVNNKQCFVPTQAALEQAGWTVPVALRADIPDDPALVDEILRKAAQAALSAGGSATVTGFTHLGTQYGLHSMDGDDNVTYAFVYPKD